MSITKTTIILLFLFILNSCYSKRANNLETEINNFVSKKDSTLILKLDTISSFEWEELLIAGPYTDLHRIEEYNLSSFSNEIKHYDSFTFFGFIDKKIGVKWIQLNETKVYEKLLKGGKNGYNTYSKKDCIFELKR